MVRARSAAVVAWIVLASTVLLATPAGADPSVRVVPTPTTQGSPVSIFGSGFCGAPSCPPVRLLIDGREVATASAQPDGSVRFDVLAPSPPNQYVVVAEQSGAVPSSATAGLLVLPADTAPPSSGTPPATKSTTRTTTAGRQPPTSTATRPPSTRVADGNSSSSARSSRNRAGGSNHSGSWIAILIGLAALVALVFAGRRGWLRRHE